MRISILQTDIVWENKQENLRRLREKLETLRGTTEIVVLPETFSTGFSMDTASLAEPTTGETIATLRQWSEEYRLALTGSYIACETASEGRKPSYYNRAFFLTPEGNTYYYDKRHLFRMGHETEHFTSGNRRPIIRYRGWNILLLVCYDLRFPVWSRNTSNEYDLLIYVANWPIPRRKVWDILLQARAGKHQLCLRCQPYRQGRQRHSTQRRQCGLLSEGGSACHCARQRRGDCHCLLNLSSLQEFRLKFPAWKDADEFVISSNNSSQ